MFSRDNWVILDITVLYYIWCFYDHYGTVLKTKLNSIKLYISRDIWVVLCINVLYLLLLHIVKLLRWKSLKKFLILDYKIRVKIIYYFGSTIVNNSCYSRSFQYIKLRRQCLILFLLKPILTINYLFGPNVM